VLKENRTQAADQLFGAMFVRAGCLREAELRRVQARSFSFALPGLTGLSQHNRSKAGIPQACLDHRKFAPA
jgi:hypothetical protein